LLLWNCEKEELLSELQNNENGRISLRHITSKQIPTITNVLKSKFSFAKNNNSLLNINFNNILEVVDSLNTKTYSFKTYNTSKDNSFINVVISQTENQVSEPLVYKYIATNHFFSEYTNGIKYFSEFEGRIEIYTLDKYLNNTKNKNHQSKNFDGAPCNSIEVGDNNFGDIFDNNNTTGGSESYNCEVIRSVESCSCGNDLGLMVQEEDNHTWVKIVVYTIDCQRDYSQKSLKTETLCGGSNSTNNGPSNIGVNEPKIEVCDDDNCNCPNGYVKDANGKCIKETNCEKLNRLVSDSNTKIKESLQNLKNNININGENGTEFTHDFTNGSDAANLAPTNTNQITFIPRPELYAAAHTHPPVATYPMFSFADVLLLFDIYRKSRSDLKPNATLFLVSKETSSSQANVYAITFKDVNLFGTKLSQEINSIESNDPDSNSNLSTAQKVTLLEQSYENKERENETGISGTLVSNEQTFLNFF
jgi:hypothetical protein